MNSRLFRHRLTPSLVAIAAVLVGVSWWYLQRSGCTGDLKQGTGDVAGALALEGRAFAVHFLGMLTLALAVSAHLRPRWLRAAAVVASLPSAYVSFLALALFGGHAAWVCAR